MPISGMSAMQLQNLATIAAAAAQVTANPSSSQMSSSNGGGLAGLASQGTQNIFTPLCALVCCALRLWSRGEMWLIRTLTFDTIQVSPKKNS